MSPRLICHTSCHAIPDFHGRLTKLSRWASAICSSCTLSCGRPSRSYRGRGCGMPERRGKYSSEVKLGLTAKIAALYRDSVSASCTDCPRRGQLIGNFHGQEIHN